MNTKASRKRSRGESSSELKSTTASYIVVPAHVARLYRFHSLFLLPSSRVSNGPGALAHICSALAGIQAQDPGAASLALWNRLAARGRSSSLCRAELLAAFSSQTAEHGVIRCHGQRGTLHLYDVETWPIVSAAVRERLLESRGRAVGKAALEDAHDDLAAKLRAGKSVTADDFSPSTEFPLRYSAFMSVTFSGLGARTNIAGKTVIGPWASVVPADTPAWEMPEFHEAVANLAEKYFAVFGPATERDFRYYFGLTATVSKRTVEMLEEHGALVRVRIEPVEGEHFRGFSEESLIARSSADKLSKLKSKQRRGQTSLPLMLLGRFDVLLLGHEDKSWIVPPEMKRKVWSANADVLPVVIVRGQAVGLWSYALSKGKGQTEVSVSVQLFPGTDWDEKRDLDALKSRVADMAEKYFTVDSWDVSVEHLS